jgi:lauroyl/myristoyl acyltransferase
VSALKDRLIETGFAAGWGVVRALPLPVARSLFRAAADRAYRKGGPGTQRLRRNLGHVVPEDRLEATVQAGLRSYARYWMEAFRLPSQSKAQFLAGFSISDEHYGWLKSGVADGRGVILALPHVANWDAAAAWVVSNGWPMVTVAERLKPAGVFEQFVVYREKLGMEVLPLTGSDDHVFGVLAERLRGGGFVCLVADRDLSERGVPVTFFGRQSRMPAGPAALSVRTGAPLIPATLHYDGPDLVITFHETIERDGGPAAMTQRCADAFAEGIAAHPQDWHMLQRIFVD